MRVALCLAGEPRSFKKCSKNILQWCSGLSHVPVDVFIHAWDSSERFNIHWDQKELTEALQSCFYTSHVKVENQIVSGRESVRENRRLNLHYGTSFAYSLSESFRMCRSYAFMHNIIYDYVVWSRMDVLHLSPIDWEEVLKLKYSKMYITSGFPHVMRVDQDPEQQHGLYIIDDLSGICTWESSASFIKLFSYMETETFPSFFGFDNAFFRFLVKEGFSCRILSCVLISKIERDLDLPVHESNLV